MFNMCMKSARWLMYVLEGKDIVVYKHCFCYEKFVTSKTKEYVFFPRTIALLFGSLISTGHVTQPLSILANTISCIFHCR